MHFVGPRTSFGASDVDIVGGRKMNRVHRRILFGASPLLVSLLLGPSALVAQDTRDPEAILAAKEWEKDQMTGPAQLPQRVPPGRKKCRALANIAGKYR